MGRVINSRLHLTICIKNAQMCRIICIYILMCWNADISLNTFIFSCLALLFIFLTNTFSKYKTKAFENPLVYALLFVAASMQLIEFFLWRNLTNKNMNNLLSRIAGWIPLLQILILIFMIHNNTIKYTILLSYSIFLLFYYFYIELYKTIIFETTIGKNGHLVWEWIGTKGYDNVFFYITLLFYIIPLFFIHLPILNLFIVFSLFASIFFYLKHRTFGTMWCWSINLFLLYFIVDILIIKPYYEYNNLC